MCWYDLSQTTEISSQQNCLCAPLNVQVKLCVPVATSNSCWYGSGKTPCLKAVSDLKIPVK